MCGINGVNRSDQTLVRGMNATLHHRGPDDEGTYVDRGITLGSCRLKVIDLSQAGHQPLSNADGTRWIVLNGEIYNYRSLRENLTALGRTFRSDSDTEVILQAYEAWGQEFIHRLEGMWAFAIYDAPRRELLLSRDRMGVKPLYFLSDGETFAFSSELKTFTLPPFRRAIDPVGLRELLGLGFNPSRRTALAGVQKLRAGELLRYSLVDRDWGIERYWFRAAGIPHSNGHASLPHVVRSAIESNLVSDVPVGCYLSGGIDSSLVALYYSEFYPGRLHTYTVGFDGAADERPQARALANRIGAGYHELAVEPEQVARGFDEIVYYYDLAVTDPAFVPNFFLARRAKQDVTVVLAGEGGDELFGGYDYYRALRAVERGHLARFARWSGSLATAAHRLDLVGDGTMKTLATLGRVNGGLEYLVDLYSPLPVDRLRRMIPGYDPTGVLRDMTREALGERLASSAPPFLYYDQMFLLAEKFNTKADRASSSFGLEERVPLQERVVAEYANRLPLREKVGWRQGKLPLRELLASHAPELAGRRKQGFEPPTRGWLRGVLADRLTHGYDVLVRHGALAPHSGDRLLERIHSGTANPNEVKFAWNILVVGEGLHGYGYAT